VIFNQEPVKRGDNDNNRKGANAGGKLNRDQIIQICKVE